MASAGPDYSLSVVDFSMSAFSVPANDFASCGSSGRHRASHIGAIFPLPSTRTVIVISVYSADFRVAT